MANGLEVDFVTSHLDARALALEKDIWKACSPTSQGGGVVILGAARLRLSATLPQGRRLDQAMS